MINQNVVLNDQWKCVSKADLVRSVRALNEWCDQMDQQGQPEEEPENARAIVYYCIRDTKSKRRSAKQIWDIIFEATAGECKTVKELSSHYLLFYQLKQWAEEDKFLLERGEQPEFFSVTEYHRSKVTNFTFSLPASE